MDLGVDEKKETELVEETKDYSEMAGDIAEGIGTLSVNEDGTAVKDEKSKEAPLLPENKTFMVDGCEYKVVYVNKGKGRFTCKPYKGGY